MQVGWNAGNNDGCVLLSEVVLTCHWKDDLEEEKMRKEEGMTEGDSFEGEE